MAAPVTEWLLSLIYPVPMPTRTRDRPMEVLALGLSRSGTDSLRGALYELGYSEIYHAYYVQSCQGDDGRFWLPLIWRKMKGLPVPTDQFDRVFGQCQGVTGEFVDSSVPSSSSSNSVMHTCFHRLTAVRRPTSQLVWTGIDGSISKRQGHTQSTSRS